ncbi:hypothetical protein D7V90_08125 [bacterium 1xD42-87]|nr:hypothetical protein D7V90_08125 [bacterium 1xD42-87]
MKTSEQILNEIQSAIQLNKNAKAKCNTALTDAISLILHNEKELQNRLDEEYKRGLNDAWEIAKEVFDDRNYCAILNVFEYDSTLAEVIRNHNPIEVKKKILAYKEEQEKIRAGDVVQDNNDGTKATILDYDAETSLEDERYWMVYTENRCVESWCENTFTKTGESVDVCNALIK